jgi:hypothetical protein
MDWCSWIDIFKCINLIRLLAYMLIFVDLFARYRLIQYLIEYRWLVFAKSPEHSEQTHNNNIQPISTA